MFQLARTFKKPSAGANAQRGFPAPGAGNQTSGDFSPAPRDVAWSAVYPTQGQPTFAAPGGPAGGQRGYGAPGAPEQRRPRGSMPNAVVASGRAVEVWTPYYDRGAAAYVQNFGKVLTNPIGAGVVNKYRPQASYGPAAQYNNGIIFWTSQGIPTSVNLQGLTSPDVLAAVLGPVNVLAAIRTTG
jgi:hypothetical protein